MTPVPRPAPASVWINAVFSRPDFFPEEIVSLSIDVSDLPEGNHVVRVGNVDKDLILRDFSVPLAEDILFYAWSVEKEPKQGD